MPKNEKIKQTLKEKQIFSKNTGILPKIPNQEKYNLIGQVASLMLSSKVHRQYKIDDIGAMFLPAIHLNQFRIYRNKQNDPVGLVTWANLSKEVSQKYRKGRQNLSLEDWNSGKNIWIIDFIAPYGHARQIIKDLRSNIFEGKQGKALRVKEDGSFKGFWKLRGMKGDENDI